MDWEVVFKFITASLVSVGAGGALVFALSSWLGKVWARRIIAGESHKLNKDLEKAKRELDVIKETTLKFQNDKIVIYRSAIDIVSNLLAAFDADEMGRLTPEATAHHFEEFNRNRIQVYGYLAMVAPQHVMDAQDQLMDYLLLISSKAEAYQWKNVRELALNMLNAIRVDIGVDKGPITYNGIL